MTRPITPRRHRLVPRISATEGRVRHLEVNGVLPPGSGIVPLIANSNMGSGGFRSVPAGTSGVPLTWDTYSVDSNSGLRAPVSGVYAVLVECIGLFSLVHNPPHVYLYPQVGTSPANPGLLPFIPVSIPSFGGVEAIASGCLDFGAISAGTIIRIGINNQEGGSINAPDVLQVATMIRLS